MSYDFILLIVISFITTFFMTPHIINYLRNIKLQVKDVHKQGEPSVPRSGGIAVLTGIIASLFLLVFINVFIKQTTQDIIYLLAAIITLTLIAFIACCNSINGCCCRNYYYRSTFSRKSKFWIALPAYFSPCCCSRSC